MPDTHDQKARVDAAQEFAEHVARTRFEDLPAKTVAVTKRSILDTMIEQIGRLDARLGPKDRAKFEEYLTSVRDVERRIQKAEEQSARELPVVDQPMGIPGGFAEHATLMMDLLALAYQTDLTRVSTFMMGAEISSRAYPEIGVSDSHHPLSHHTNDPVKLERLSRINEFHVQQFAHLVDRCAMRNLYWDNYLQALAKMASLMKSQCNYLDIQIVRF